MLCENPISTMGGMVPCRQCMSCRVNRQRVMSCRIQLEALWHPYSIFVTLTYDDEYVSVNDYALPTLKPEDVTLFLKRFRNRNGAFRYYYCGEYGEQTHRPHYHLVLFGPSELWAERVQEAWSDPDTDCSMGYISVFPLSPARASYVAQYTTKKLTGKNARGLHGRYPEMARASNRPGIGANAVPWLANQHMTRLGSEALLEHGDVFTSIRIDGKIWPIGQYMRKKLRDRLSIPQDPRDRAAMFGKHYEPVEGDWVDPLPVDYCPEADIAEVMTPRRRVQIEQETKAALPEIRKAAEKRDRRRKRRQAGTQRV